MKKFTPAILILIALPFIFYLIYRPQTKITNYPSSGTDIIAFGDSLVVGVGSTQSGGFVKILSEDLKIPIVNLGISGDTTQEALNRIWQISKYKPKVVIVLLGGNDFLQKIPRRETFNNLDKIVETIQKTGSVVLLVGLDGHIIGDGDRKFFDSLVKSRGTAYVPDILNGIFGRPEFMFDTLHPNDKGYRIMADRIGPVLQKLLNNK